MNDCCLSIKEISSSAVVRVGLTLGTSLVSPSIISIPATALVGWCNRSKLVRELAALFFSNCFPLPKVSSSYFTKTEGGHTYYIQKHAEVGKCTPEWAMGQHFLDKVTTLKNGASIFLGALPHRIHAKWLENQGCNVVISMIESKEYDVSRVFSKVVRPEEWAQFSVDHYQFPTPDFLPLPQETLNKATTTALKCLREGKTIYVHCKAGRGRCAAVVALVLCELFNKKLDEAIGILLKSRSQVNLNANQQEPLREFIENKPV